MTSTFPKDSQIIEILCDRTMLAGDLLTSLQSRFPRSGWTLEKLEASLMRGKRRGKYNVVAVAPGSIEVAWQLNREMIPLNSSQNKAFQPLCPREIQSSIPSALSTLQGLYQTVNEVLGNSTVLSPDGSLTGITDITGIGTGSITGFGDISADELSGQLTTAAQPGITGLGALDGLNMAGNITMNGHNVVGAGSVTATSFGGTVTTASQPAITSVGTLDSLESSGTISGAQIRSDDIIENQVLIGGPSGRILSVGSLGTAGEALLSAGPGNIPAFGGIDDDPSGSDLFMRSLRNSAAKYHLGTASATITDFGIVMTPPLKWWGGVLGTDGKVYGIPFSHSFILVISPDAGTAVVTDFGTAMTSTEKWVGGVLAPNGKIYGIPAAHSQIMVLDPVAGSVVLTDMGISLVGATKWFGGVLAPNGKIYGIPWVQSTGILIIDPLANTATVADMGAVLNTTTQKFIGGVLAPNGKIYGIPYAYTAVLVIDPSSGTATTTTMGLSAAALSGGFKWSGGVLGSDGQIYCAPFFSQTHVLVIDPSNDTAIVTNFGITFTTTSEFRGGLFGPDGKLYMMPNAHTTGPLIIDTVSGTATITTLGVTVGITLNKWTGGVLASNGKIYGIPVDQTSGVLIISNQWAPPLSSDVTRSAYLNKF